MGEVDCLAGEIRFPKEVSVGFCAQDAWLRVSKLRAAVDPPDIPAFSACR
jgi:hypothetical protein